MQPKALNGSLYVPTLYGMFVVNMSDGSLLWRDVRAREAGVPLLLPDGQLVHNRCVAPCVQARVCVPLNCSTDVL